MRTPPGGRQPLKSVILILSGGARSTEGQRLPSCPCQHQPQALVLRLSRSAYGRAQISEQEEKRYTSSRCISPDPIWRLSPPNYTLNPWRTKPARKAQGSPVGPGGKLPAGFYPSPFSFIYVLFAKSRRYLPGCFWRLKIGLCLGWGEF